MAMPLLCEFHDDAVEDGGAELGFDVVADEGEVGLLEACGPGGIAGEEDGDAVDHGDTGIKAGFGVELGGFLAADGEVVDEDGGAGFFEGADDVVLEVGAGFVGDDGAVSVGEILHVGGDAVGEGAGEATRASSRHRGRGRRSGA